MQCLTRLSRKVAFEPRPNLRRQVKDVLQIRCGQYGNSGMWRGQSERVGSWA